MAEKPVDTGMQGLPDDSYNAVESLHSGSYASSQCTAIITEIPEELNETKLFYYFRKKARKKLITDLGRFEVDRARQTAYLIFEDRDGSY